jgi:hypothetical protein
MACLATRTVRRRWRVFEHEALEFTDDRRLLRQVPIRQFAPAHAGAHHRETYMRHARVFYPGPLLGSEGRQYVGVAGHWSIVV